MSCNLHATVSVVCQNVLDVEGVTQLHDVVYMVSRFSSKILSFNATTHQRLTDIDVKDLRSPWDITACEQTLQLYVADYEECVWRVSVEGDDIKRFLPKSPSDTFRPWKLSVTSTRLLVTSHDTKQLIQFDLDGDELRRVQLPDYMEPYHAVESPNGAFVVSHRSTPLLQHQVSEVNMDGDVLRQFSSSRVSSPELPLHLAIDSRGNIFVADFQNRRILLLDGRLTLRRCIVEERQLNYKPPLRMCYLERTGQLLAALEKSVAVFDVLCR